MKTDRPSQYTRRNLKLARLVALSSILLLTFSIFGSAGHTVHAAPAFTFSNYEVARSGNQTSAGVTCPGAGPKCWNWHAEPNIATAPDGTIYITSENTAFNHPSECQPGLAAELLYTCGGTGAWKSTDRGTHFTTLLSPNTNYEGGIPLTFWGGDTHVAVALVRNTNGQFNVYVVSLEAAGSGLIGIGESTSQDGGANWAPPTHVPFTMVNPNAAPGVQDRPWVAAYGADEVCVESHTGAVFPGVFCSFNDGLTFTQSASAFDSAHSFLTAETSIPGVLRIDPNNGYMYLPFSGLQNATEAANPVEVGCGSTTNIACPYLNHAIYMAVSTNGGVTFTDYPVYVNPNVKTSYGEQFVNTAIDKAGNVYEVYSDGVSLFYSYSRDHGQTWNAHPIKVNQAPSGWAVMPWSTAGDAGKIDIVWYGTDGCGSGVTDVDNCDIHANWHVYFAQNQNVFSNPTGFTQIAVTGPIHQGPVCLNGSGCQSYRGLFDDFGVTSDPTTGLATIVYDNDQYTPTDQNNLPNPDCASTYTPSNDPAQQNCVHTNIAHQTSGPVVQQPPCRESDGEGDFHGTNGNGHVSFDRDGCRDGDRDSIDETNRGDGRDFHSTEIDSVQYDDTAHTMTVVGLGTVNGLPVAFTFVALETGLGTPGAVSFVYSDGYTNAGPLTSGSIILH